MIAISGQKKSIQLDIKSNDLIVCSVYVHCSFCFMPLISM